MTLQNRVLPTGDIVADPARGTLTGNRGILHDGDRTLGAARWTHPHWISCTLDYKGTRRTPMTPGTWTELFFLDEAVAMAAGHRPCALCRRPAFGAFQVAWAQATGQSAPAPAIDRILHAARVTRDRRQVRHAAALADLAPGTFVLWQGHPHLVCADHLRPWTPAAYGAPVDRPRADVTVLTPAPMVAVLRAGYNPIVHPSAEAPLMPEPVHQGAPESLIEHWQKRRGEMLLHPGESLPPLDADLAAIAAAVVPETWPPLPPDASRHAEKARNLAPEFAGKSALYHLHGLLIAHLRKRSFPGHAPALFRRLWVEQGDHLRAGLSTRWLMSAIITFGDHGATEGERSLGREMGMMFSLMKLYEFERLFSGNLPDQPYRLGKRADADLPLGMEPFSLSSGGLDINVLAPLWVRARAEPVLGPVACDLLGLMNTDHGTIFARLHAMREKKRKRLAGKPET